MNKDKLTDEEMLAMVGDPLKLARILYMISQLPDLDDLIKEHGEQTIFELACEVTKDASGGDR